MNNLFKRILSSIIIFPISIYFIFKGSYILMIFSTVCLIIACYEWNKISQSKSYKSFGFIFLIVSFFTFYSLSAEFINALIVILICVTTDIGGYVFGKLLKGPKLTKISPNKTYAGMIGGYFLSLISLATIIDLINYSEIPIQFFIVIIIISTVSQAGDIFISYFKRASKLKNTGKIIPGHGGLLDRIDGMIFAFPMYYLINLTGFLKI